MIKTSLFSSAENAIGLMGGCDSYGNREQTKAKSPSRLLPKTSVLSGQLEISCPFLDFSFGLSVYSSFSLQTLDYAAVDFERRNILC